METVMEAVVDRMLKHEGKAVLIVGEMEEERIISIEQLPITAEEGDWVQVTLLNDAIVAIFFDSVKTQSAKQRIQDKVAALKKSARSQFKVKDQ